MRLGYILALKFNLANTIDEWRRVRYTYTFSFFVFQIHLRHRAFTPFSIQDQVAFQGPLTPLLKLAYGAAIAALCVYYSRLPYCVCD